jgi:Replication initiator protein A (RepA) N-terminus.
MNQQSLPHDYYYGSEAEQYTFYRFPKVLFSNDRYKSMSDSAKILYGLMLDRMGLPLKNGWLDKENRVFIYFTLEDLQEYMNCGHNKGVKIMAELDNIGLIERVKQGLGRPTIIYVKRFSTDTVNSPTPEQPPNGSFQQDYPQGTPDFRKAETQTSDYGKSRLPQRGS